MANLDKLAAEHARNMVKVVEETYGRDGKKVKASEADTLFTKALGVLQENGIYAAFLLLLSRSGDADKPADPMKMKAEQLSACFAAAELLGLLDEPDLKYLHLAMPNTPDWRAVNAQKKKILDHLAGEVCTADLDKLLFVKALFEQTLIYARYGAKARDTGE
jgi:hypothetical protein